MPASRPFASPLFLLALLLACAWSPRAAAQLQRCTTPGGGTVYTDRRCADIGAVDRLPRGQAATGGRMYRRGCTRTLRDLVDEITAAIDAKDANRLAGVYHWNGMPTQAAYAVMQRLDGVVNRRLVDILPLYPRPPPVLAEDGSVLDQNADGYYPQPSPNKPPYALRLEQTLGKGASSASTVLGLRRNLGCWWITL